VGALEVDRAPVTNARYAAFVAATAHRSPLFWPKGCCPEALRDHPVTGIDVFDALAFARWAGGAIPTEEQWLLATGVGKPAAYVWGDSFDSKRCNTAKSGIKGTTPVGKYEAGTAPSGCVDMCGNVWEMTCTAFPGEDDSIVVKGGSWHDLPAHARLDTRFRTRANKGSSTVGLRLVYGVPERLPHFLDRGLADRCIAFRRARPRRLDREGREGGEFDDVVRSLHERAAPHLARLHLEAIESALSAGPLAAPPPPPFRRRCADAWREISKAACWKRVLPVVRVFLRPGRSGRFAAAWAEAQRPRRGPPLRQALAAAALALFPDRGRAFKERARSEWSALPGRIRRGGRALLRGLEVLRARVCRRRLR
jgi:hypothetical protein